MCYFKVIFFCLLLLTFKLLPKVSAEIYVYVFKTLENEK